MGRTPPATPRAVPLLGVVGALAMLLGVLTVHAWPRLPPRWLDLTLLLAALPLLWLPRARVLGLCLLGLGWCALRADIAMQARLPRADDGRDFIVTGQVEGLPRRREDATRFVLRVESAERAGAHQPLRGLLRLSWYDAAPAELAACSRWRLRLRLKRPRGLVNPGGHDSERQALERGIVAVGYVREDPANAWLGQRAWCVDGLRERLSADIAARVPDPHDAALLQAFAIGDTRGLDEDDWQVARINGIPHLIAISGFHVGVAGLFGAALAWLAWLVWPRLGLRIVFAQAQALAVLLSASAYGILAGGSLPTVRTLLMIGVFALTRLLRRNASGPHTLALALLAILVVDPLATLAPGFWLSFVGVAFLMLCLVRGPRSLRGFVHELSAGQLVMTIALLPLGIWFFGEASLVGALSNLVAVPLVSFVIVPLCLLATLALLLVPALATAPLLPAAWIAHQQWRLLEWAATWPGAHGYLPEPSPLALLLAMLGAAWLLLPRGVPARLLGAALFLPLLLPRPGAPAAGAFEAVVLDVGQGLAVIVRTQRHTLVYDTGARYRSGFDLGAAAVLPSLRALGVRQLDLLVLSHGDNDHVGGAGSLVHGLPPGRVLAGEPMRGEVRAEACLAGQGWDWDGVQFRMLGPPVTGERALRGNDRSCVLLVATPGGRLLLPGDIGARAEAPLAPALAGGPPLALVVPHHGSAGSSSAPFLAAAAPQLALVSAGWRNRFGHPAPRTLARYAAAGSALASTAQDGALTLAVAADAAPALVGRERDRRRRYWRE